MESGITQKHLNLIAQIYNLPLSPDGWQSVLDRFAPMINACFAGTTVHDPKYSYNLNDITSNFGHSFMQEYRDNMPSDYQTPFAKMTENPRREFISDREMNFFDSDEEYAKRPIIQWLTNNHDLHHGAASCLNLNRAWTDILMVMFSTKHGSITDQEKKTGNFFLDHFAKSIELGRSFEVLKSRFNGAFTVLDRFHMGIFVLSSNGSIVLKNTEAERLVEQGDGLNISQQGLLHPTDYEERAELKNAITKAISTAQGQYNCAETLLTISHKSNKESYLVEVSPLRDKDEISSNFNGCIVFVIDPDKTDIVSTEGMQTLYNLTNSEKEVCKLLAEGCATEDIADSRNLTRETVRNYVKQILHKTGTKNRTQLVRLALNVNLPIDPKPDEK